MKEATLYQKIDAQNKAIGELQDIVINQSNQIKEVVKLYNDTQNELNHYRSLTFRREQLTACYGFAIESIKSNGISFEQDSVKEIALAYHSELESESLKLVEADRKSYDDKQKAASEKNAEANQSVEHDGQMNG